MKKTHYRRKRRGGRSYRAIGAMTALLTLISLSLLFLVSGEACLFTALYGAVVLSFSAIVSAGVKAALDVEREKSESTAAKSGAPLRRF